MSREEAIEQLQNCKDLIKQDGQDYLDERDFPLLDMAIEALQGDMYCPNCGARLVPEAEYLEPTHTHGRLIDADALSKKLCGTTIFIKDGEVFQRMINDAPTVHADRPHGEWICKGDYAECSECGGSSGTQFDGVEPIPRITAFCPHCGVDMRKEKK